MHSRHDIINLARQACVALAVLLAGSAGALEFSDQLSISSCTTGSSGTGANAYDGNKTTAYTSADSLAEAHITLNLGASHTVKTLRLLVLNGDTVTYPVKVEVGVNTTDMTTVANVEAGGTKYIAITLPGEKAQFVRISLSEANSATTNVLAIAEVQVWGKVSTEGNLFPDHGTAGIGTTTPDTNYKLDVRGTIRAQELEVPTTGADYVFEKSHMLKSLKEVEAFVKKHQHLPDIEPAAKMQKDGMKVSKQVVKHLAKIEELTLHAIELDKTAKQLETQHKADMDDLKKLKEKLNDTTKGGTK